MDSKKSNKIRDIVRLQQILKKWKKMANASKNSTNSTTNNSITTSTTTSKSIKFLKRTLSFQDVPGTASSNEQAVPKGSLAVCVGPRDGATKRFIIPMEFLSHQAFGILLRQAEEEFGFQQEGVLKIPCEVDVFEKVLKVVEEKKEVNHFFLMNNIVHNNEFGFAADKDKIGCYSPPSDSELNPHHPQMCR